MYCTIYDISQFRLILLNTFCMLEHFAKTWGLTDQSDFVNVDLNSLEYSNARSVWPEYVMLSQIKEYGLDNIIKNVWFDQNQINCANILSSHTRVTSSFNTSTNEIAHIRWNTGPNLRQTDIYNTLKIQHNPIWRVTTKIPTVKCRQDIQNKDVVTKKQGIFWERA